MPSSRSGPDGAGALPAAVVSLVDSSVDAVAVVDAEQRLIHFNRAYARLVEIRERELRSQRPAGLCHQALGLTTCREPESCLSKRAIAHGRAVRMDEVRGSKEDRVYILTAVPLFDDGGKPQGAIETYRDVSAESRMQARYKELLEAERKRSAALQEELDEARGQLLRIFRDEAEEITERLVSELTALPSADETSKPVLLTRAMREAHTLKGSAAIVGLDEVSGLAHLCENVLLGCQRGDRKPDFKTVDVVLGAVDSICVYLESSESTGPAREVLEAARRRVDDLLGGKLTEATARSRRPIRREPMMRVPASQVEALSKTTDALQRAVAAGLGTDALTALLEDARVRARALTLAPIASLFESFERAIQQRAAAAGKRVEIVSEGGDFAVDRRLLESLRGPLTHLVNNALDHGIETPDDRRSAGKPEAARLSLSARRDGEMLELQVADDGAGIDVGRIREVAQARGLVGADAAKTLSEGASIELIWQPGFSTARTVSHTSGRGVGLDAVRDQVAELGGTVVVAETKRGRGTVFRLRVPIRRD